MLSVYHAVVARKQEAYHSYFGYSCYSCSANPESLQFTSYSGIRIPITAQYDYERRDGHPLQTCLYQDYSVTEVTLDRDSERLGINDDTIALLKSLHHITAPKVGLPGINLNLQYPLSYHEFATYGLAMATPSYGV